MSYTPLPAFLESLPQAGPSLRLGVPCRKEYHRPLPCEGDRA